MARTRGDRGTQGRRPPKKPGRKAAKPVRVHPTFGAIPLVERAATTAAGKPYTYFEYDLTYRPHVPTGAVRGDVSRQHFCPLCHVPRYFYEDQQRVCVQCGESFVFAAKEQKYWYETLQFHFDSVAVRCLTCRRRQRSERALRQQIAATLERLTQHEDDPAALVELAEATVGLHRKCGRGDLNRAIASCRQARKVWPKQYDALYWEAIAQHLAGRDARAVPALEAYLASPRRRGDGRLRKEAAALLDTLTQAAIPSVS